MEKNQPSLANTARYILQNSDCLPVLAKTISAVDRRHGYHAPNANEEFGE